MIRSHSSATKTQIFAYQLNMNGVPPEQATQAATILASGSLAQTAEELKLLRLCLDTIRSHEPGS